MGDTEKACWRERRHTDEEEEEEEPGDQAWLEAVAS